MESVHEGSQGKESKGVKRAFGEGRAPKINPSLRHVHKFHALFIGCYTETERMANKKFRRELRPLLLLVTAAFRPPSCGRPCSLLHMKMLHMNGLFPRISVGSGPSCFLFLNDGFSDFIAAGLGLIPRGGEDYRTSGRRFHVGIGGVMCIFRVLLVCPSRFSNGKNSKILLFFCI